MEPRTQIYHFTWQGIEIEATYTPQKWGGVIAHLEIRSLNADSELMPPAIPRNSRPGFRTDPAHHSD